ncbi:ferric reduction oxidase 7, chloroplastic-like [Rosa sericea]
MANAESELLSARLYQPLFSNPTADGAPSSNGGNKNRFFLSLSKWVLKFTMWFIFIAWVALFLLVPTDLGTTLSNDWLAATGGTLFGDSGSVLLLYSGPILAIAILAFPYIIIVGKEEQQLQECACNTLKDRNCTPPILCLLKSTLIYYRKKKPPRFNLWTFPVLVDGQLGVVSAAELIGIILFVVFVLWDLYAYTVVNFELLATYGDLSLGETRLLFLLNFARNLGQIGLVCLTFLFLPVARGSVLFRLINIPFEHATRYHVWLGNLTMLLFTIHGLLYVLIWTIKGCFLNQILEWKDTGVANLAGSISLSVGLLMWITTLPPVRKRNFELFLYTHQLYIILVVFLALHIGYLVFPTAAGPIFIFVLDRFLRFCQSRKSVDIISAKCLPCGTVELVLAKPESLRYNALSFVFVRAWELSRLQWHPFSVSSSPMDGKYHISVLIKAIGKWTEKLRDSALKNLELPCTKLTISVEGPYGHEKPYHMMYENLILVAGGIGISPFLAVLSDILHSVKEGKPCLPRNILLVWAVKRSDELSLLSTISMDSTICPSFSNKLNLQAHIYVTRESEFPLEHGEVGNSTADSSDLCPMSKRSGMSVLVGTGHNIWSCLYVISSTLGFVILLGLLDFFYINPFDITSWSYKGFLFLACMVASVFIFGGLVVCLWHLSEKRTSAEEKCEDDESNFGKTEHTETVAHNVAHQESPTSLTRSIRYGARPDFKEIFGSVSKNWGHVDVGVIVCGPPTLQSSVAKEIRSQSVRRQSGDPIYHFNSHSFSL